MPHCLTCEKPLIAVTFTLQWQLGTPEPPLPIGATLVKSDYDPVKEAVLQKHGGFTTWCKVYVPANVHYGYRGCDYFCTLRCGYRWAVRHAGRS